MKSATRERVLLFAFDIFATVSIIAGIIGSVWAYSGQPFPGSQPLVVIETGSMTHEKEPFGRIGYIDPGDIVIAKAISGKHGVIPYYKAKNSFPNYKKYGDYGDVIIYEPMGNKNRIPIIHRAICWIQYDAQNGTYTVEEYGIYNETSVNIPEIGLHGVKFSHSGFITKGDHNPYCDQSPLAGICREPVKVEWIIGKAEGELPWFGALKLLVEGSHQEVPRDSWICLAITLTLIFLIPLSMDIKDILIGKKEQNLPVRWVEQLDRDFITRKKILKKATVAYWVITVFLVTLFFFYPFLLIAPAILLCINFYTAMLIRKDSIIWSKKPITWTILSCLLGPLILAIYYMKNMEINAL